jgi:small multidrug resistance pump
MITAYIYLFAAIVFEVAGTILMKISEGFAKPAPSVLMIVCYIVCFGALTMALKKIDVGLAYAIWAGIGTALIAIAGFLFFKESFSVTKGVALLLIISGVALLNLVRGEH